MFKFYKKNKKADKFKLNYNKISTNPKITFFTGAGISAESGLHTFRSENGLWNSHRIEDVCSAQAIKNDFKKVNDFYNERRTEMLNVEPNSAHLLIKEMEKFFEVAVVTQNVDNLHEKSGSKEIIHLHGEITKSRPLGNTKIIYDQVSEIKIGDRCPVTNAQLRPYIILFNEPLDTDIYNKAKRHIRESDIVVVIGTSLEVNPAAYLLTEANSKAELYVINPDIEINKEYFSHFYKDINLIEKKATEGMKILLEALIKKQ